LITGYLNSYEEVNLYSIDGFVASIHGGCECNELVNDTSRNQGQYAAISHDILP
jgi:hypothetical protein